MRVLVQIQLPSLNIQIFQHNFVKTENNIISAKAEKVLRYIVVKYTIYEQELKFCR
jgi:hypothetical protein